MSKIIAGPTYKLLLSFAVIPDVYRSYIPNKTAFTKYMYCLTLWISKPQSRHSKYKCLQDWANFHRSWAWQIVLIFNTSIALEILSKFIFPNTCIVMSCFVLFQNFQKVVPPIPIFEKLNDTYSQGQVWFLVVCYYLFRYCLLFLLIS